MPALETLKIQRAPGYRALAANATLPEKRHRLADLLVEAAEFEHNVLCQYLFAAASFKRHPDEGVSWAQLECMRRWEAAILQVARQEMEHLGLVNNLLTAIGEAPHFIRPDYPFASPYRSVDAPFTLTPFSRSTLLRFMCYEMPLNPPPEIAKQLGEHIKDFSPGNFDGLALMYGEIRDLLAEIAAIDKTLFIGPPSAQFNTLDIIPGTSIRGVPLNPRTPRYNFSMMPVVDLPTALATVDQIVNEGEGGQGVPPPTSHFMIFYTVWEELESEHRRDAGFAPARRAGDNPVLKPAEGYAGREHMTLVDNPAAVLLSHLFDTAYSTMLLILLRYFTHTDETESQVEALQQAAFFPLMTAVIRPVAELLTQFPASTGSPDIRAGAGFRVGRRMAFLPHRRSAWNVIATQLQLMRDLAGEARAIPGLPDAAARRLDMVYQNIARIALIFGENMGVTETDD